MKVTHLHNTFTNPVGGAALQIHVSTGARENRLRKIDKDGLIFIDLEDHLTTYSEINQSLCRFLSELLGISVADIEVAAGVEGDDKLVCIFDLPVETVNQRFAFYAAK